MSRGTSLVLTALVTAGAAGHAVADEIHLADTPIALRGCRIEGFDSGQVVYRDARGRREAMALEEIRALGFDGMEALDDAEKALADGDMAGGRLLLLQALLDAPTTVSRIWCHARLSRVHDRRGEYLAAVRHAAEVWRMDPDPSWRSLKPLRKPADGADVGSYAVAVEALDALKRARATVVQRALLGLIDELTDVVKPIHARLRAAHDGPAPDPTTTISGVPRDAIRAGAIDADATADAAPAPARGSTPVIESGGARSAGTGPSSPQIQRLLESGRFGEALAACRAAAVNPGDRSLDRLLYQYGAAHLGAGDHRRAAVMFTRIAVHYPGSTLAVAGLIETAVIHHRHLGKPRTARRLLRNALARAEQLDNGALIERAQRELDELPRIPDGDES